MGKQQEVAVNDEAERLSDAGVRFNTAPPPEKEANG